MSLCPLILAAYWTVLSSQPYSDPSQNPTGATFNAELAALPVFRDCALVNQSSLRRAPNDRAAFRRLEENYVGGADDPRWLSLAGNPKPDRPLFSYMVTKRDAAALVGPVDLDRGQYAEWKAAHTNFFSFRMLSEWGVDLTHLKQRAGRIADPARRDEFLREWCAPVPDRYAQMDLAHRYVDRLVDLHYGDRDAFTAMHSFFALGHVAAAWGAKALMVETTNTTGPKMDKEYRWAVQGMFTRGAARQFGVPWGWYVAVYFNGPRRDGSWMNNSTPSYSVRSATKFPEAGVSASLFSRVCHYAYLNGANAVEVESWPSHLLMRGDDGRDVLSPRGKLFSAYHDFTRRHPGRGVPHTPVAVLVPFAQGYPATGGKSWAAFDYKPGDYALDAVFFTLQRGFDRPAAMRRGVEANLHNSPYPVMCDVLCPDSPQDPEAFFSVLTNYPVAILAGEYRDRSFEPIISRYEAAGGRLLRITPDMLPPFGGDLPADVFSGRRMFPKLDSFFADVRDRFFPIKVQGDVLWGLNKTEGGWWVWCLNNNGVTKFADAFEEVDESAASRIRVDLGAAASARVRELISERDVSVRGGGFGWTVPAGGVAVFEICERGFARTDVVLENDDFKLTLGEDACARSLVVKSTGEECVDASCRKPFLAVTQDRPFDNELKLMQPNKRVVYPATKLRREGDLLLFGFGHGMYEAAVRVKVEPGYLLFTLEDFPFERKGSYSYLKMDVPQASSCRFVQIPLRNRKNFGNWLNACWDDRAAVCVAGASPHPDIDHEDIPGGKVLYADAIAGIRLRGATAAVFAAPGREAFLDAMDSFERDLGLPRGVKSRRSCVVSEPIFHVSSDFSPSNVDDVVSYARKGGFRLVTLGFGNLFKTLPSWGLCGDYDWRDDLPNGEADVREMLAKFHSAGILVGFHTLHSHIGFKSRYVTPVADPRLNKTRRFTLAAPLPADTNATEISVFEPTADVPKFAPCRILQFGGELVSYESCTEEPPYRFLGARRGALGTRVTAHGRGEVGGILDVSEFGSPGSCYLDQNTDLQDEVGAKLARAYNCGFDYVYLDGSEGVNRPFGFHVANAQLRYWKQLKPEPLFGEAAAKTHFGWHMLAGANAFDVFPPEMFKKSLRAYPLAQAPITQQDMTRIDFGWWSYSPPKRDDGGRGWKTLGTQADLWEYGVSSATAWNCAASIVMDLAALRAHPRTDDIFATMRRWADVRRRGLFKEEWRAEIKNHPREHHLLVDAEGNFDLVRYEEILAGDSGRPIRAFYFEKDGASWVVYWHCVGEGRLWLPIVASEIALYDEFAGKPVKVEALNGGVVIPAGKRLYLKSALGRSALVAAFSACRLEKLHLQKKPER